MDIKHIGLISIIFTWVNLFFVMWRWKGNKSMTLSQHVAQSTRGIIYYFLVFAIALPPFAIFIFNWLVPEYDLPVLFSVFMWIALVGQMLAVTVPETSGWKVPVHRFFAFLMAFVLLPLVLLIALNQNIHDFARVIAAISALYMFFAQTLYNLNYKPLHENFLIVQAVYVALFHFSIIAAAYL